MTIINVYNDDEFSLNDSLCKDCTFRMSRVVKPLNLETFGITEEDLKELDLEDDDEILIEQHICLVTQDEMDYSVKKCNYFKEKKEVSLFSSNPYE